MTKQIKLSELKADVEKGMKKDALVKKYTDGNVAAMTTLLKQAGLTIKKTRKSPAFELVDDTVAVEETVGEIRNSRSLISNN